MKIYDKTCKRCKKQYKHKNRESQYCGQQCARRAVSSRWDTRCTRQHVCKLSDCGKHFKTMDKSKLYCSELCSNIAFTMSRKNTEAKRRYDVQVGYKPSMSMYLWNYDTCLICGSKQDIELGHNTPVSRGGETSLKNCFPVCAECNRGKGGMHTKTWEEWVTNKEV